MMDILFDQERQNRLDRAALLSEGIGIGKAEGFWQLVCRKLLTKETAAKELGVSVAEFDKLCEKYAFAK